MSRGPGKEVLAARDGGFTFDGVSMGSCELYVSAKGYASASVDLASGETGLEVMLHRAASVEGLVIGEDGRPVAARLYRISDPRMLPLGDYQWDDVDASGRFRYEGREPGELCLRAITEDGREGEITVDVREGAEIRDLALRVGEPWRSQLRIRALVAGGTPRKIWFDVDGKPRVEWQGDVATLLFREAPGTEVSLCIAENVRGNEDGRSAHRVLVTSPRTDLAVADVLLPELVQVRLETNAPHARAEFEHGPLPERQRKDGTWQLSPECSYSVKVWARGFMGEEIETWRPPAGGGALRLQLKRASAIHGVVVDEEGAPVAGAIVRTGRAAASGKTDEQGRFTLESLPEGEHVVLVERDHRKIAAARVRAGSDALEATLVARPYRTIRGRVVDAAGRPVGGTAVAFVSVLRSERYPDSMGDSTGTYTHADGSFELEAPGVDGFLLAEKKGYGTTPATLDHAGAIVLPRPAFVCVDATTAAKDGFDWTYSVRWPDVVPEAVWDVDYYLPHTVEVAPGRVEIVGNYEKMRDDLEPGFGGTRSRTIDVGEGETAEVTFDR